MLSGTIDKYLVGMAEGIRNAQEELSRIRLSRPGEAPITYHLPSLEFELKFGFEVGEEVEDSGPAFPGFPILKSTLAGAAPPKKKAAPFLLTPLNPGASGGGTFSAETASTIKGKFVSIPANGGAPLPVMRAHVDDSDGGRNDAVVAVRVANTAGEPVAGAEVEFNVDGDFSALLNQELVAEKKLKKGEEKLKPSTKFQTALSRTDADGWAFSTLRVNGPEGQYVALAVYALGMEESLIYQIPGKG